jgi:hypothetical protein
MNYPECENKMLKYQQYIGKNYIVDCIGKVRLDYIIVYPNNDDLVMDMTTINSTILRHPSTLAALHLVDCRLLFMFNYDKRFIMFGTNCLSEENFITQILKGQ